MEDLLILILALVALFVVFWFYVLLPMQMAGNRNRNKLGWVLVSLFFSPVIAIIGLLLLGDAPEQSML